MVLIWHSYQDLKDDIRKAVQDFVIVSETTLCRDELS
jgi:hypothetical protein